MGKQGGMVAAFLVGFSVVAGFVFRALWSSGAVLMTVDDNVGLITSYRKVIHATPLANWVSENLWGMPVISAVNLWGLAVGVLPPSVFMNIYHGLCLVLAGWFLALFLKDKGLRPAACMFGGLVAFWVGTNLTLTYAGHVGKYGMMIFLSLTIFALGRFGKTGRVAWSVFAGAAAGVMYLHQPDVSLFNTLLLVPLGVFESIKAVGGLNFVAIIRKVWGAVLVAALLAGGMVLMAKGSGVEGAKDQQSPAEHWAFITQWSQPPSECLDFIAPGWTGWRSGDEAGPYWGKMGRSDGWEQTRQGFMNFKLENVYVGAIPLLFALFAIAMAFQRRRQDADTAKVVFLWGGLCLFALLLAFGKFFILYKPLSWLPGFSSIRNPNKFIHFFQVSWGVLAAFGLDAALRLDGRLAKKWGWGSAIVAGLFLLVGAVLWSDLASGAARLSAMGWGAAMGRSIQWNKAFAVTYAGGALLVGAGLLWLLSRKSSPVWKSALAWAAVLVVVFDAAVILAPHYIQTMPKGYTAENELVRYLKREVGHNRTAMATQDGFYNLWLTYLFPFHGIPSVNVTQLPRPPADYSAFWNAVRDPVRTWQLTGVSHVLAHGPVAAQLLANPAWAAQLELAWAYQPFDDGQGGVATRSVPVSLNAPEVVLKLKSRPPRVAVFSSWRVAEDAQVLATLASPSFVPFSTVMLAPGSEATAQPAGESGRGVPAVEITRIIPGRYEFTATTHVPVVVRVAEKFDPGWKATVNGKAVPVLRCDFMFQGVALDSAGVHQVVMAYRPSFLPIVLQGAGLIAGLGAGIWLLVPRRKQQQERTV